jgi:biotin carboxyl carrier protein
VKYFVRTPERAYEVTVDGGRVTVDGEPFEAHFAAVPGTPLYHLLLGGESWTVAAQELTGEAGGARWALGLVGERVEVTVVDERTRQIQALTGQRLSVLSGGVVKAPMPGLVVRVEVREGQRVEAGAGLVVVEAMKMENELRAVRPGMVSRVHVTPGQTVDRGTPLVTLESVEPSG